ncbi:MAG: DUF3883 domain-containing protein [Roseiarcus sp.]|jgi:hypothetical protein
MSSARFLSRGIDYLGDLGAKLRDLQGYRTLAHELIQNADDARDATSMVFDVHDGALIVDNDGVFSDCQQIEEPECPWKTDGTRGHRCDFHRFRHVASGDKRGEAGTTGAFGIGFIAVYQVTDCPELISAGRHWILHEDRPEDQRIEVCAGCPRCTQPGLPGTRFILPWALNVDSKLRQALRAEPVPEDGSKRMLEELERSLPIAMLFLKRLRTIEIRQSDRQVRAFQRVDDDDSLILSDGQIKNDRIWHIIRGDFSEAADTLRAEHPGRIESKRSSQVVLAIPTSPLQAGLLCACLPTEQDVGLPFHINADFFPTNDRKRVILADDYQSEWNREALRAAGRVIGQIVGRLPALLGAARFWGLVSTLKEVADRVAKGHGEPTLAEFWKALEPQLQTAPVIYTTRDRWTTCADASLLLQREEAGVIFSLEGLDVNIVHEDLRPYQNLLRAVGVPLFNIERLCNALVSHGLDCRWDLSALPPCVDTALAREALWGEIALLLERQQRTPRAKADDERRLSEVALAPGRDNALWPCGEIYSSDEETVTLFESLGVDIPFVSSDGAFASLVGLCRPFNAAAAIAALGRIDCEQLERSWYETRLPLRQLFEWFENRRQEILADATTTQRLAALPIFPSSGKLRVLDSLALPGNFEDPLALAELVDLAALGGRREFLSDLGMPALDFRTYAVARLPATLRDAAVTSDKRRAAVILLANRVGELRDDQEARKALASAPLIECTDGEFRQAHECYFGTSAVRECLSDNIHLGSLPKGHEAAVYDLYSWLGVADAPRLADVVSMVRKLSQLPYSAPVSLRIQKIIAHLGKRVEADDDPVELKYLKGTQWLPARGNADRWYRPNELYAVYQDYLFDSQALFLDAPANVQIESRSLLMFLGVHLTPPTDLVVKHLIHRATQRVPVNDQVYRFLNDKIGDPSIAQLKNKKCLWLGDAYHAPSQVFWGEHPFGRYRRRLSEELRGYSKLLTELRVRDAPDHHDALSVLNEISTEFGTTNSPLDEDSYAVLMASWRLLENALDRAVLSPDDLLELGTMKCVPNEDRVLNPPQWMFFENRAGLAAKFGEFLTKNVISRPLGAGNAFAAAGVRPLGSAIEVELLECTDPVDDQEMVDAILERRNEIGRVLYSQVTGQAATVALSQLDNIRCGSAASLTIRHRLTVFGRELYSNSEQVPALYQLDEVTLMFARREGQMPWAAMARELAVALFPEEDPGRFAAGLKEVMAAKTVTEAAAILDELGFARLDTAVRGPPTTGEAAGTLGADTLPGEPVRLGPAIGTITPRESEDLTLEEALKRLLGSDAPPPTPPAPELGPEPVRTGGGSGPGMTRGLAQRKGRPVLRSYLPSPDGPNSGDADRDDEGDRQGRSPVDEAGVRRVLEYEKTCGRSSKEMPHKNPGYDIQSADGSGKVTRYIEVKSFSGRWSNTYAVLSRPQFNKANELGDSFWLYVVERAETDDFQIHRIQNPALRANHFMFDDGWRATAEPQPAK